MGRTCSTRFREWRYRADIDQYELSYAPTVYDVRVIAISLQYYSTKRSPSVETPLTQITPIRQHSICGQD